MGEVKRASKQVCFSRSKHLYSFNIEYITMLISNCAAVGKHVSTAEFRFMGPWLLYPEEPTVTQVLEKPGKAERPVVFTRSLAPGLPPRHAPGKGPKVIEAKMTRNVTLGTPADLRVKLDLPPEQIGRVMFFESGFKWMGQHPLRYDKEHGCWTAAVAPGSRDRIQENEYIYVWAEGKDGFRSEYHPVKVGWDFSKP
ncbi:MAG: hypothetical protein LBC18_04710 [Opitutaceae bacterium]|jgi:hypothetical protein|nr:hypothetical protein [Opitutaceae bacterium]